jgi:hypothetical protein
LQHCCRGIQRYSAVYNAIQRYTGHISHWFINLAMMMLRRQRPYADRIWSLDTVIKCSKMRSIAPVRLACFHAISVSIWLCHPYRTPRSFVERFTPTTKDIQYLAQPFRLYCICATAIQSFEPLRLWFFTELAL